MTHSSNGQRVIVTEREMALVRWKQIFQKSLGPVLAIF